MKITLEDIKKNNRMQNQFAFYYLLEYGRKNILDDAFLDKIKEEISVRDDKKKIITNDFMIVSLDIARDMANLNQDDIYKFVYDDIKELKRQERER